MVVLILYDFVLPVVILSSMMNTKNRSSIYYQQNLELLVVYFFTLMTCFVSVLLIKRTRKTSFFFFFSFLLLHVNQQRQNYKCYADTPEVKDDFLNALLFNLNLANGGVGPGSTIFRVDFLQELYFVSMAGTF